MWLKWCYILVKDTITVEGEDNDNKKEINYSLKIMLHLDYAHQKSIVHL